MTVQRKPRLSLSIDDESMDLLKGIEALTGISPAQTIQKIFPAHLQELWEYRTWLEQLPADSKWLRAMAPQLLQSYGPENLIEGIKKLDPGYVTEGEKFAHGVKA
jgi:hypothetical protein